MSTTIYRINEKGELVPVGKNKNKHKRATSRDDTSFSYPLDEPTPTAFTYPTYRFKAETVLEVLDGVLRDPWVKWDSDQIKNTFVERLNAIITDREGEKALATLGA
ncbi:unnamed protein product [Sphagnum jensenii]